MISVIHNHGTSFKGLMAYLMHDPDHAKTSDRVAWTQTHNLATDDPELGWKTMAATAMNQADLKAEAGIKNTGRKSNKHVMHFTLSWHDEERSELTRDEMIQAALASMGYIGTHEGEKLGKSKKAQRTQYADEHQAIIVCHEEPGKSPHVHVALNRVHPEHGVMLPDSKDYEKLSAWALEYRQAQGKDHYCPERQKNAAKKAQGLKTSHRRKPRAAYEAEQEHAAADPDTRKKAFLAIQRQRAAGLMTKKIEMKKLHAHAMHTLENEQLRAERDGRTQTAERIRTEKARIRANFAPKIDALTERQQNELQAFNKAKTTKIGRVRNTWAALKTKQWMTEIRTKPLHAATSAFKLAFDSGLQQRDIEKHHRKEIRALGGERRRAERAAAEKQRTEYRESIETQRQDYAKQRNDLILKQEMDRAKLKAEWHQLQRDRQAAMIEDERAPDARSRPESQIDQSPGSQKRNRKRDHQSPSSTRTDQKLPVNNINIHNVPIESLREMARKIKEIEQNQEKERGPERE